MKNRTILALLLVLILAACNASNPAPEATSTLDEAGIPTPTEAPTSTPIPATATPTPAPSQTPTLTVTPLPQNYGPDNFPTGVNPLTGLQVTNPALLERRPLAVKIQLFPRGQRPPWGISLADIVYDYYQNNGLTRFHTIFYGNDAEQVGPIRSARLLDSALIRMYKSIFAFGGADQRILNVLFNAEYADRLVVEGNTTLPMRRVDPNGFNFLITNTQELSKYASGKGINNARQDLNGMSFQYEAPANGQPGSQVAVRYSISAYTRWDFDAASGRYLRFQDTQEDTGGGEAYGPLVDRLNEQQISASNVVVLLAPHEYAYQSSSGNSEIIDIKLTGTGKAFAFRDGQEYEVTWNRPTLESVLYLTNTDGSAFPFKPGSTWFEVIGTSSIIAKRNEGGLWRFEMRLP